MTTLALDDDLPEMAAPRPAWLMTLADLALLLVGFFVFVQASQQLDRHALARGIRAGFGAQEASGAIAPVPMAPSPMAVSAGALSGFATGSATSSAAPDSLIAWAREATRDPRVTLRVAGSVDGTAADTDPLTRSGAVLATDRARAVASLLLVAHAVPADRIAIVTAGGRARRVVVTTGFAAPDAVPPVAPSTGDRP